MENTTFLLYSAYCVVHNSHHRKLIFNNIYAVYKGTAYVVYTLPKAVTLISELNQNQSLNKYSCLYLDSLIKLFWSVAGRDKIASLFGRSEARSPRLGIPPCSTPPPCCLWPGSPEHASLHCTHNTTHSQPTVAAGTQVRGTCVHSVLIKYGEDEEGERGMGSSNRSRLWKRRWRLN